MRIRESDALERLRRQGWAFRLGEGDRVFVTSRPDHAPKWSDAELEARAFVEQNRAAIVAALKGEPPPWDDGEETARALDELDAAGVDPNAEGLEEAYLDLEEALIERDRAMVESACRALVALANAREKGTSLQPDFKKRTSQRARIVALLKSRGEAGVLNTELNAVPIYRYSARIAELREEGYGIDTQQIDQTTFRFVLRSEPKEAAA